MPRTVDPAQAVRSVEEAFQQAKRDLAAVRNEIGDIQTRLKSVTAKASYLPEASSQHQEAVGEMVQLESSLDALRKDEQRILNAIAGLEEDLATKYRGYFREEYKVTLRQRIAAAGRIADGYEEAADTVEPVMESLQSVHDAADAWNQSWGQEDTLRQKAGLPTKIVGRSNYRPLLVNVETLVTEFRKHASDFRKMAQEANAQLMDLEEGVDRTH